MSEEGLDCLVLQTDTLRVEVIPALGGKISSMRYREVELLQAPLRPYARRSAGMGFEESDASGIDECLPSVSACTIAMGSGEVQIPDHGEFWRLSCEVEQRAPREVRLTATGSVLPLRFERVLKLEGETLRVDYRLENVGDAAVPYIWSAHPLFSVDAGDGIVLPSSVSTITVEGSAHKRLGAKGETQGWPRAKLQGGGEVDLSRAGVVGDDTGDKVYTAAPPEGWAAIERRHAGLRVTVGFDPPQTPYLGLWLCYGGWPEGEAQRQQCVALEPCTAPGDSLAEAIEEGWARWISPGESCFWRMTVMVSEMV